MLEVNNRGKQVRTLIVLTAIFLDVFNAFYNETFTSEKKKEPSGVTKLKITVI